MKLVARDWKTTSPEWPEESWYTRFYVKLDEDEALPPGEVKQLEFVPSYMPLARPTEWQAFCAQIVEEAGAQSVYYRCPGQRFVHAPGGYVIGNRAMVYQHGGMDV